MNTVSHATYILQQYYAVDSTLLSLKWTALVRHLDLFFVSPEPVFSKRPSGHFNQKARDIVMLWTVVE